MKTELFDFDLPESLIAQIPAEKRSESRLLVFDRSKESIEHKKFFDIVEYFQSGDLLVLNSSKVIPARLFTVPDQGSVKPCEILFIKDLGHGEFEAMVRPGKKFKIGRRHTLPEGVIVEVLGIKEGGLRILKTIGRSDSVEIFRKHGEMPLPPYITSRDSSPDRYQTVFSDQEGSVAAPTAGLHFEEEIFEKLKSRGVTVSTVTLHVGLGTFKPIEAEYLENHHMHEEIYYISPETAEVFSETKKRGNKVWACGTTSVRTLESAIDDSGQLRTGWQSTDCFIKPGYTFKAVDRMITNFHLPKSSLIVLVSAFCGRDQAIKIYHEAIKEKYRFYSFGDSMVMI
jgi:S-adenosylmethionine:tRNA ribosyltransferase-isomerase